MKKLSTYFFNLIFIFVLAATSCYAKNSRTEAKSPVVYTKDKGPEAVKDYSPTAENVKQIGRAYEFCDILWAGYSSTGCAFNVNAKTLEIDILSCGSVPAETSQARVVVFVNDDRVVDKMIDDSYQTITVFSCKKAVQGEVKVLKVTESAQSWIGISSLRVDENGTVTPVAAKDMKIEFIGDSITCGYGIDDPDRNNHFKTATEDNTKTYAYKTAEKLNADYSMVCVSGSGVISGYTGSSSRNESALVPSFYDKLGFTWGNTTINDKSPNEIQWDFSKFVPDVVVINLGTNDNSYTKGNSAKCKEYEDAYVAFLKDIRSKNPDAYIICTLGLMGKELLPSIQNAVARTKDSKITWLELPSTSAYGTCADWHPCEKANEASAEILIEKIKSLGTK